MSARRRRLTARDRILAWLVTGPLARGAGFLGDLAVAVWRSARGRPLD